MATVRGRLTANAMMSAMSCALIDVAAYISSTECLTPVSVMWLDDDHAHVRQKFLSQ